MIDLKDYELLDCNGCTACTMGMSMGKNTGCSLADKDDKQKIMDVMLEQDAVIFSAPTYDLMPSSLFLKFMHRNLAYESAFLTKIGAPCAAMDIMSAKVEKSMNNSINRKVNCDTANADKVVAAAQEQIDAIRRIERDYGLDVLPEKLQSAALLRIANPEASLADLATLSYPPVTKSCLNYRLKKLMEFHMDD